jgi:hypothetical protein
MFYKHEEKNRAIQIDTTQQTPEVRQPKKESKFDTRHFIPNTERTACMKLKARLWRSMLGYNSQSTQKNMITFKPG